MIRNNRLMIAVSVACAIASIFLVSKFLKRDSPVALSQPVANSDLAERVARELKGRPDLAGRQSARERLAARIAELQPTEAELMEMSSADLVLEIAESTAVVSLAHSARTGADKLFAALAMNHRGVDVLLARPDAAASLLQTYLSFAAELEDLGTVAEDRHNGLEFAALEVMLAADAALEQFEAAGQLPVVIESVLNSLERQATYDAAQSEAVYGQFFVDHSATVVGRCLERLEKAEFIEWLNAEGRSGILTVHSPTEEESIEILNMAGGDFSQ